MGESTGYLHRRLAQLFEPDTSNRRVLAMEGLRGLAILLVFLCHYKVVILARLSPAFSSAFFETTVQIGGTGVDLFFLLSGMLIYRAALRRDLHLGKFLARRVQRIYPTFLVAFAIYFVASVLLHQGPQRVPNTLGGAASYVVLNMLLLPGIVDVQPLIPAAWSLSYEICFYVAIPILVLTLRMSHWSRLRRCLLWTSLLMLHLVYVLTLPQTLPIYRYQSNNFLRFGMFLAGMLAFEILASVRAANWLTIKRQSWLSVIGAAAGLAYCFIIFRDVNIEHLPVFHSAIKAGLICITYTSLALATLGENGLWKAIFSNAWLRWTGNVSYSLYLIHGIVLNSVIAVLLHASTVRNHPSISAVVLLPVSLAITFMASMLLFLAVEKPLSLQPPKALTPAFDSRSVVDSRTVQPETSATL
jgi:exopolysaccharide production protein ExoZ